MTNAPVERFESGIYDSPVDHAITDETRSRIDTFRQSILSEQELRAYVSVHEQLVPRLSKLSLDDLVRVENFLNEMAREEVSSQEEIQEGQQE
jgi:hypothetical protein